MFFCEYMWSGSGEVLIFQADIGFFTLLPIVFVSMRSSYSRDKNCINPFFWYLRGTQLKAAYDI